MISGKPVCADTCVTGDAAAVRSSVAVPPVERIATPRWCSACANSTRPSLLETLSSARRIERRTHVAIDRFRPRSAVRLQLLAQRAAIDAENVGGAALVALGVVEHGLEQRLFDFAQHEVVQLAGLVPVQRREVRARAPLRSSCAAAAARGAGLCDAALDELSFFFSAPWALRQSFRHCGVRPRRQSRASASASKYASAHARAASARLSPASRHDVKRAPAARPFAYQSMCLRATLTPASSP